MSWREKVKQRRGGIQTHRTCHGELRVVESECNLKACSWRSFWSFWGQGVCAVKSRRHDSGEIDWYSTYVRSLGQKKRTVSSEELPKVGQFSLWLIKIDFQPISKFQVRKRNQQLSKGQLTNNYEGANHPVITLWHFYVWHSFKLIVTQSIKSKIRQLIVSKSYRRGKSPAFVVTRSTKS